MTSLAALALAEARMLARNRTAAFNAVALPLVFGGLWLVADTPQAGEAGPIAALQVIAVLAFTVFSVAATTLVARRQQRVLKRWRASPASTPAILTATVAPLGLLLVVQAGVLLTATALATGAAPARPLLLGAVALAGGGLCGALAFLTAACTRTVETTTVTAAPVVFALLGGAVWALTVAPADVTWPMLATGGGALAQLTRLAWDGGDPALLGPALGTTALLAVAAVALALRLFRWEPRS